MSRQIRIGELRDQITIQEYTPSVSGGDFSKSWANISTDSTPWANVRYMRPGSNEFEAMQKITSSQALHITIRYRTDLKMENRVVFNSEDFNIHSIHHRVERDFTTLICSKVE